MRSRKHRGTGNESELIGRGGTQSCSGLPHPLEENRRLQEAILGLDKERDCSDAKLERIEKPSQEASLPSFKTHRARVLPLCGDIDDGSNLGQCPMGRKR